MEKIFVNPKRKTLQTYISKCISEIDKGCSARLLRYFAAPDWRKYKGKEGIIRDSGGSVAGAYGYMAFSSVLELAWWISSSGDRHVRVKAGRIDVANNNVPKLIHGTGWSAVYPNRSVQKTSRLRDRAIRIIERRGKPGDDDRFLLRYYEICALSKEGVLIADSKARPKTVQVVVTCPSTGERHCIGVPPKFANPRSKTYEKLGSEAARVHAAIAWTFNLKPEEYQPVLAS